MQERVTTRNTSIRISTNEERAIEAIIAAGWARTQSQAIAYALRVTLEQLREKNVA